MADTETGSPAAMRLSRCSECGNFAIARHLGAVNCDRALFRRLANHFLDTPGEIGQVVGAQSRIGCQATGSRNRRGLAVRLCIDGWRRANAAISGDIVSCVPQILPPPCPPLN